MSKTEFFDRVARKGDLATFSEEELKKLEWFFERWNIQPGMCVLEPGCGKGRLTERLVERVGPSGRIVAFDVSPEMIAECEKRVPAENVRCFVGDAESIELPRAEFDRVICFSVFPHFNDKTLAVRRLVEAMKDEGRFFVAHATSRARLNEFHNNVGDAVAHDRLPDRDEMIEIFESAGMRVLELVDGEDRYHLEAVKDLG